MTGVGLLYGENQAVDMIGEDGIMAAFDAWAARFTQAVTAKGKVNPGIYRAFGYEALGHRWADLKLKWRETRMKAGYAPEGSSPAIQENLKLNDDTGLSPTKAEGEKLRK